MSRHCGFILPNGRPCKATLLRDGVFCVFHDPGHAEEVAEARRLGGLRRRKERTVIGAFELEPLDETAGIRRLLEIAGFDALAFESSILRARLLVAVALAAIRLLETTDHETRLAALEAAVEARRFASSATDQEDGA
jgi:hypothetical protein